MRIVLIGCGVVGQSLLKILSHLKTELVRKHDLHPKVVAVADKGGAAINLKGLNLERMLFLKTQKGTVAACNSCGRLGMSSLDVIESVEAEVLVEATSTNVKDGEPGLSNIKTALRTGKHVITTNKGPLALAMPVLTELAERNEVYFRFSGAVGAGTPILDLAKRCLSGDRIISIRGILNGTTNYSLTEMEEKRITLQQALANAQKLGYAEADVSMDVDGIDSACKLVIMANWIMNKRFTLRNVDIQGVRGVTLKDLQEATRKGCMLKLIASIINDDLKVKPTEIARHDPLCVNGVLNAVTFVSKFAGEITIIGRGAGGMETSSAILRDLLDVKQDSASKRTV